MSKAMRSSLMCGLRDCLERTTINPAALGMAALRDYLTKLREDAYIDIKPGYIDTGASPNETKPVYTTAAEENAKKLKKKKKLGII